MATIKSYSDLQQSKKLAKILPIESADMHYNNASIKGVNYVDEYRAELMAYNDAIKLLSKYNMINPLCEVIPCWSLTALLEILPYPSLLRTSFGWRCDTSKKDGYTIKMGDYADNPIDTCYEMIIKLHEQKLL